MEDTLALALTRACANLNEIAADLGAESVAVIHSADGRTNLAHRWSRSTHGEAARPSVDQWRRLIWPGFVSGAVEAGSVAAGQFREAISPGSRSFFVVQWHASPRAIAIVFGFADRAPGAIPETATAGMDAAALAVWSAFETGKLRAELKETNARLAGRKLVEKAKGVLQLERGISEESAYAYLRGQSRRRRITLAKLAEEVVRSHGGLNRVASHS